MLERPIDESAGVGVLGIGQKRVFGYVTERDLAAMAQRMVDRRDQDHLTRRHRPSFEVIAQRIDQDDTDIGPRLADRLDNLRGTHIVNADLYLGKKAPVPPKQGRKHVGRYGLVGRNRQARAFILRMTTEDRVDLFLGRKQLLSHLIEYLPLPGGRDAARMALEQLQPHLLLQVLHLEAYAGLREA